MPEPPKYDDAARQEEIAQRRAKARANRTGRSSTILTSSQGLTDDDSVIETKSLLGN